MKKFYFIILFFVLSIFAYSENNKTFNYKLDVQLFADISSSYYGKSYPAVVEYAERFEKYFSDSHFLPQILVLKGESLFHLNRFSEAEKSLHAVLNFSNLEENLFFLSNYWLGKIYFASQDYNKSIDFFYNAAFSFSKINLEQQEKLNSLYMDSLLNAAFSYYENKLYKDAILIFEDLIQKGNNFLEDDYYKALISLFDSYNFLHFLPMLDFQHK